MATMRAQLHFMSVLKFTRIRFEGGLSCVVSFCGSENTLRIYAAQMPQSAETLYFTVGANTALDRSFIILEKFEWNIQTGFKRYA